MRGRIPTAWYPTSVSVSADGRSLFVTNANGVGAGPYDKPIAPDPTRRNQPVVDGLTGYDDTYCNCLFDSYTGRLAVALLLRGARARPRGGPGASLVEGQP